ncbi:MAG: cyclic nucleotide-binding domain-containing protein [Deltaproteobacteria bacterium]|nr:cyclic nucleotide-binding domain-containing protein [Deltaproteobacteria bacterium]
MSARSASDVTKLKDQAAKYIVKGSWGSAIKVLLQAQQLAPNDTYIARKIGDCYQRDGDNDSAVEAYKVAAKLFAAAGFLFKAISVNKIILSIDPNETDVQEALAALYSKRDGPARPAPKHWRAVEEMQFGMVEPEQIGMVETVQLDPVEPQQPDPVESEQVQGSEAVAEEAFEIDLDLAKVDPEKLPWTPLFSDLMEEELNRVIDRIVPVYAAAGTVICREGDQADSMFVISHGLVRVTSRDTSGNPLWLTNLSEGEFFGEFGFFADGKRHADVIAAEDVELLQIGKKEIEEIVNEFPRIREVLYLFYKQRVVDTLLAKNPLFKSLSPPQRKELIEQASLEIHEAGSTIIQEGDDGESLYILKNGEAEVFTAMGDERIDLAVLKPGDIFGEISILTGMPTSANVVAQTRTELVKFSKREVMAMAEKHQQLAHLLSETKEHRVEETIQRILTEGFV